MIVTGDNASNNDTMIQYLGCALEEFPGPENQTRCFAHTVNLIAKSILKPFEVQKMKDIQEFNDVVQGLADTSEEENAKEEDEEEDEDDEDEDEEGEDEGEDEFDTSLEPIKSMLLKVCLHFMTLILSWLTNLSSYGKLPLRSRIL
jgi:hypothetical protein